MYILHNAIHHRPLLVVMTKKRNLIIIWRMTRLGAWIRYSLSFFYRTPSSNLIFGAPNILFASDGLPFSPIFSKAAIKSIARFISLDPFIVESMVPSQYVNLEITESIFLPKFSGLKINIHSGRT